MTRRVEWIVFVVVALHSLGAGLTFAAQDPVTLRGTVMDPSGSVLVGAAIEVRRGDQMAMTAATGSDGTYRAELPCAGTYHITVYREGFVTKRRSVAVTSSTTVDVTLTIAPLTDTVVVTPSRTAERRASVTEAVSVVTADDIRRLGNRSLAEIVRLVPGLSVESNGREGAFASLFARGGESDYNHVIVDGVRVNLSGGQFDFSRIAAGEIDRIEVVRGAQSALYGSDAIGAVVQVFTRRGTPSDPPHVSGSIERGSFGTWRSDVSLLGGAGRRVDYHVGVASRNTQGAFADTLPETDRFDHTAISGTVGLQLPAQLRLRTNARYSSARGRGVGQIAYGPGDRGTQDDSEEVAWHLRAEQILTSTLHHTATLAHFRSERLSADAMTDPQYNVYALLEGGPGARFPESPRLVRLLDDASLAALLVDPSSLPARQFVATTPFGVSDFPSVFEAQFRRSSIRYQLDLTWGGMQTFSAGYEYERETDPLHGFLVDDHAYFAQQQLTLSDHWFVTGGARLDDHSDYGTEVSPKLSVGGHPLPFTAGLVSSVKVFANLGKGIKNPEFSERFGSAFVDGNADLRPERARTLDAGVEVTFDEQRWLGRATVFTNTYTDQVAFRFSPGFGGDGVPDFLNIAGSKARGVELEAELQRPMAGLSAHASYAWVDTEVVSTVSGGDQFQPGQPLLRRPRHTGTLELTYSKGRTSVYGLVSAVGQRHDSSFLGLARVSDGRPVEITVNPGYTVVGIGSQVRLDDGVTVFVRVDNLTDTVYESALGYPGLPRSVVVGGRFTLGGGR